jgi:hypothetical protein
VIFVEILDRSIDNWHSAILLTELPRRALALNMKNIHWPHLNPRRCEAALKPWIHGEIDCKYFLVSLKRKAPEVVTEQSNGNLLYTYLCASFKSACTLTQTRLHVSGSCGGSWRGCIISSAGSKAQYKVTTLLGYCLPRPEGGYLSPREARPKVLA